MSRIPSPLRGVPEGRELILALTELFPDHPGWVLASGIIEDVELTVVSAEADSKRALRGRFVLAQLSGPRGGPYGATLSRVDNDRLEVLAGTLTRARAVQVQAMYVPSEGAGAWVPAPAATKETREVEAPEPSAATTGSSWGAIAHATMKGQAKPAPEAPAEPETGDLVEHFAFGLCEVLSAEGDRLMLRDLSRGGRAREIRADVLTIHPPTERNGKRVFRLSRRG